MRSVPSIYSEGGAAFPQRRPFPPKVQHRKHSAILGVVRTPIALDQGDMLRLGQWEAGLIPNGQVMHCQ